MLHGVLAAGSRSGSVVAMDGTSVANAQITRELVKDIIQPAREPGGDGFRGLAANGRNKVQRWASRAEGEGEDVARQVDARTAPASAQSGPEVNSVNTRKPPTERMGRGRITNGPRTRVDRRPTWNTNE